MPAGMATGPESTAAAAMSLLGWVNQKDLLWVTVSGLLVNIGTADPCTVKFSATPEVEAWLWRRAAAGHEYLAHLEAPPFLDAARALLAQSSQLTGRQKGLLRAFLAGSSRPLSRALQKV